MKVQTLDGNVETVTVIVLVMHQYLFKLVRHLRVVIKSFKILIYDCSYRSQNPRDHP